MVQQVERVNEVILKSECETRFPESKPALVKCGLCDDLKLYKIFQN